MGNRSATAQSGLYHFVWRWHFYAGLFVAPFVLILALTGAAYLFNEELESVLYHRILSVDPVLESVAASAQERAVLGAHKGSEILRYEAPAAPDRSSEWTLRRPDGRSVVVFVDPATAEITGEIDDGSRLGKVLVGLHGELLAGRFGDLLVEFAGCWAFVLLITGVFLWWPRKGRRAGVALPRFSAKGRSLWRELHAVPAAWNAPIIAFLILTGLPWSAFWGENLAKLGALDPLAEAMAPTPNFIASPSAPLHEAHQSHARPARLEGNPQAADLPWSIRQAVLPAGGGEQRVGIDSVIRAAQEYGVNKSGLRIIYPSGPAGVFTLSYVPDRAQEQRTIHIDPADGAVLQDVGWAQYSPLGKAVEFGVETHVGRQFGAANKWLMFASCLLLVLTVVLGVVTWWTRRPRGNIGAPPVPDDFRPNIAILIAAMVLGLVFPLVGVSMLVIILLEVGRNGLQRLGARRSR
ncbi:MAG TPA: PepSY domain-containing protein [Parvularcula sp.]|nr:PepSY domain-containing protein [Parvularcula sp.]